MFCHFVVDTRVVIQLGLLDILITDPSFRFFDRRCDHPVILLTLSLLSLSFTSPCSWNGTRREIARFEHSPFVNCHCYCIFPPLFFRNYRLWWVDCLCG